MKSRRFLLKLIATCFALVAIPVLTVAQSIEPPVPLYCMSGLIGVARGQTASIHFTNVGRVTQEVRLYFLDVDGKVLKSSTENVLPGQSVTLNFSYSELSPRGFGRGLIRGVARLGDPPGESDPPGEADPPGEHTAVCAVDVFDELTNRTTFSLLVPAVRDANVYFPTDQ